MGKSYLLIVMIVGSLSGKGSQASFSIIRNSSLPCQELAEDEQGVERKRFMATEDYMRFLFREKGGIYQPEYMAATWREAHENFPVLLDMSHDLQETIRKKLIEHGFHRNSTKLLRSEVLYVLNQERLKHKRKRDLQESGEEGGIPFKLAEELGMPPQYSTDDGWVSTGFCLYRGTFMPDGQVYRRLCTVCNAVLSFGGDVWPAHLNEAACNDGDPGCLIDPQNPDYAHGLCHSMNMAVNILERQPGQCVLVLVDGEVLVADEWDLAERGIRSGCECAMDNRSYLRDFIPVPEEDLTT